MKPQAQQYIKLLSVDPKASESQAALQTYASATVRSSSYPNWLTRDVPSLAVKSLLVTYDYQSPGLRENLTRLATSICANFERLQTEGHPKWRNVSLTPTALPKGWTYYEPTRRVLSNCGAAARPAPSPSSVTCTQSREVLGLCKTGADR
jgi:hypothetical protein